MARRLTSRVRRSRPNNSWSGVVVAAFTVVPANSKILLGSLVLSNPNIDETALRVVGHLVVLSDQSGAVEQQLGAAGLIHVSNRAITAGVASIPSPATDIEDDGWFTHQTFMTVNQDASTAQPMLYDFSSKGRRITEDGQSIAVVVENSHASFGLKIAIQFRILSRVTGT